MATHWPAVNTTGGAGPVGDVVAPGAPLAAAGSVSGAAARPSPGVVAVVGVVAVGAGCASSDATGPELGAGVMPIVFANSTHGPVAGQTWDMHSSAKNYVCVLDIDDPKSDRRSIVFSLVGCVGMMGYTSSGTTVGVNNINTESKKIDVDIETDIETDIDTVLLHPSIAVALLQMENAAVGRLWLLARSLDPAGSGRINMDALREKFTGKGSEYRVCGWRRLRMLLAQGEGLFWERDDEGRLWIYGVGHVAAVLGLEKVEGVAVHVNVKDLLNIQSCRAQFYASWFSGRKTINPISRAKITELTGVTEEQQRIYERLTKVDVKPCLAIGEQYSLEGMQEAGYQRGAVRGHGAGVTFDFIDHKGKQGKAGERYVAWHLPNQYTGRHKRAGKSSRRNINRYLKRNNILEKKLALGNVGSGDTDDALVVPIFFPHLKAAGKRRKKVRTAQEIYWEGMNTRSVQMWHVAPQGDGLS